MASQVQIPFEGVILQEHSAPISCPTPNFAKGSKKNLITHKFQPQLTGDRATEESAQRHERVEEPNQRVGSGG